MRDIPSGRETREKCRIRSYNRIKGRSYKMGRLMGHVRTYLKSLLLKIGDIVTDET